MLAVDNAAAESQPAALALSAAGTERIIRERAAAKGRLFLTLYIWGCYA
jgi:hypothetical protein